MKSPQARICSGKSYLLLLCAKVLNSNRADGHHKHYWVACNRRSSVNSGAWLRRFDHITGVVKTDILRWATRTKQKQK